MEGSDGVLAYVEFSEAVTPVARDTLDGMLICLGCNKDLWSCRSKYKSYGVLRVQSGGKGSSPGVV